MFENMTFENILKDVLNNVPSDVDKRQGSIIYDAAAPLCAVIAQMYISLDNVLNQTFADTASREYLIRRAAERGIFPKPASSSIVKAEFNVPVDIGSEFYGNGYKYIVSEKINDYTYKLICKTPGICGNLYFGPIIPVQNIQGLKNAEIIEIFVYGNDEENTEDFRKRYFESFQSLAFGGNKKDYIEKTNLIPGVGGCKVVPTFNGGGTVMLIIITSSYSVPSKEFLKSIKEQVDPDGYDGLGEGFAPIGHCVTVTGVKKREISIVADIILNDGFDISNALDEAKKLISEYFYELSKKWADTENIEIIAMKIGADIFSCKAVKSVSRVVLNNSEAFKELILDFDEIPIIKEVILNY